MLQTWPMAQQPAYQQYVPMTPAQMAYSFPPITAPPADPAPLLVLLVPLLPFIALFGAIVLILFFVGRAMRASRTFRVIVGAIVALWGLITLAHFVLIPFLINF